MKDEYILTPYYLDSLVPGLKRLSRAGWHTVAVDLPDADQQARMSEIHRELAEQVHQAVAAGRRPVSIAGDCCTTIAVLAGLQRAGLDPFMIWFDAHGDFNTWETTPSGFLGGMPLAMLVGRGELRMCHAVGLPVFSEEQVILSDARDLDPGEKEAVAGSGISHLPAVGDLLKVALPERPLYVHFDTDVLRPEDAPAMNYLAPGGPDLAEIRQVFEKLSASGRIAAVSMSAWNPELAAAERTQEVCMQLLARLLETG